MLGTCLVLGLDLAAWLVVLAWHLAVVLAPAAIALAAYRSGRRMQCAREYPKESQVITASGAHNSWTARPNVQVPPSASESTSATLPATGRSRNYASQPGGRDADRRLDRGRTPAGATASGPCTYPSSARKCSTVKSALICPIA